MRMVVLTEDYGGAILGMTDCTNEELKAILIRAEENDENGIGQSVEEICEELFPIKTFMEIGCTEQSEFYNIKDLNVKAVAYTNYLTFSVVQSEEEYK